MYVMIQWSQDPLIFLFLMFTINKLLLAGVSGPRIPFTILIKEQLLRTKLEPGLLTGVFFFFF